MLNDTVKVGSGKMKGDVKVTLLYEDGHTEEVFRENLIMRTGKTLLSKLLAGPGATTEYISKMGFGTGNAVTADTQTSLAAQVLTEAATASFPAYNSVMFTAVMGVSDGGTSVYQELALLTNTTSIMLSRVVIPPITKSALFSIQVQWTISFQ